MQGAVSEASDCTDLSSAVSQIQNAVNQRSTEYNQASAMSTSALADGALMKTDLTAALRNSLDADKDYLAWARRQLKLGCAPAAQSSAYNAAYNADMQANAAKEAFRRKCGIRSPPSTASRRNRPTASNSQPAVISVVCARLLPQKAAAKKSAAGDDNRM